MLDVASSSTQLYAKLFGDHCVRVTLNKKFRHSGLLRRQSVLLSHRIVGNGAAEFLHSKRDCHARLECLGGQGCGDEAI